VQKRRAAEQGALNRKASLDRMVKDGGGQQVELKEEEGATRQSSAWVFQNAVSDVYSLLPFEYVQNNPGASFIPMEVDKKGAYSVGSGAWKPSETSHIPMFISFTLPNPLLTHPRTRHRSDY